MTVVMSPHHERMSARGEVLVEAVGLSAVHELAIETTQI